MANTIMRLRALETQDEDYISRPAKDGADELAFLWRWVDRMARGEMSISESLNVMTHWPAAPDWVKKHTSVDTNILKTRVRNVSPTERVTEKQ